MEPKWRLSSRAVECTYECGYHTSAKITIPAYYAREICRQQGWVAHGTHYYLLPLTNIIMATVYADYTHFYSC